MILRFRWNRRPELQSWDNRLFRFLQLLRSPLMKTWSDDPWSWVEFCGAGLEFAQTVALTLVAFVFFESVSSCHECVSLWYLTNRAKVAERSRLPALASGETGWRRYCKIQLYFLDTQLDILRLFTILTWGKREGTECIFFLLGWEPKQELLSVAWKEIRRVKAWLSLHLAFCLRRGTL